MQKYQYHTNAIGVRAREAQEEFVPKNSKLEIFNDPDFRDQLDYTAQTSQFRGEEPQVNHMTCCSTPSSESKPWSEYSWSGPQPFMSHNMTLTDEELSALAKGFVKFELKTFPVYGAENE